MAYDNAERRQGAITFPLPVETILEAREELKLMQRNDRTSASGIVR